MNPHSHISHPTLRVTALALLSLLGGVALCLTSCGKNEGDAGTDSSGASTGTTTKSAGAPAAKTEPDLPPLDHPASPGEAARYLDMTTLAFMDGADPARSQTVANMSYRASGGVKAAYEFHKSQLLAGRWKELPDGKAVTDEYASAVFERAGFHVSLMANPSGDPGKIDVTLHNHGNVNLAKVPLPPGTTKVYAGPITAIHSLDAPVADTAEQCRKLVMAEGWEPYGGAGDTAYYRQNGVQLMITVMSAPAQGGKTMITCSSEQMSAAIPAPSDADDPRYNDSQRKLTYATTGAKDTVAAFYKDALGKTGWNATREEWNQQDEKDFMVFRNPDGDMMSLELRTRGGRNEVSLTYQSGAEIAAMNKRLDEQAEAFKAKRKAEMEKPVVTLSLPAGATIVSQSSNEVKLTVNTGFATTAADAWNDALHETGWLVSRGTRQGGIGTLALRREGQTLTIQFDDSNGPPAPLSVSTTGVGIEVK